MDALRKQLDTVSDQLDGDKGRIHPLNINIDMSININISIYIDMSININISIYINKKVDRRGREC